MSNSDLSPTVLPSKVNAFPDAAAKKPRDTTNRLEVRMHRSTTFLAIAYKGNLWEFFPRGTFLWLHLDNDENKISVPTTAVRWCANSRVTPILFGLLAYRKTPYRASKGEQ